MQETLHAPRHSVETRPDEPIARSGFDSRRVRVGSGKVALAACFLLALGFVAITANNYRRVAVAGDAWEAHARQTAADGTGRGTHERFARTQPPIQYDPDSLCWINLTQRQWQQGTWRPHDNPFDNAPYGRERHWSSSFSTWLLVLGGINHLVTGQPMEAAIAGSAAWANPVLFVLTLVVIGLVLRRHAGGATTGVFLVTLAACWGVEWDFSYGRPDHHGLHLMAYLGLMLAAARAGFGWVQTGPGVGEATPTRLPSEAEARRWFTVSGVCGGIGLWIGSTQQCFCVAVLGIGAVLGVLCFARPESGRRFAPELWRRWARTGAATSVGCYLLEYFPSHLEMRLEVNNPLIALGWLGAGELMTEIMRARVEPARWREHRRETLVRGVLGAMAMSVPVLAVVFGPRAWCVLGNPVLNRTMKTVSEGMGWLDFHHPGAALWNAWNYTGLLLLAIPVVGGRLILRRAAWSAASQTAMLTGLVASAVFLGWTLFQVRWIGFLESSLALLMLAAAPTLPRWRAGKRFAVPVVWLAIMLPGWLGFGAIQLVAASKDAAGFADGLLHGMFATREVAWNLQADAPEGTIVRIMGPLADAPALHYYNPHVQGVGSFYWENVAGCQATVDFYNDEGDTLARRIARERKLDYVLAVSKPSFVMELQTFKNGTAKPQFNPRTLAYRLANPAHPQPPEWLEFVPLADAPLAVRAGYRVYRVRPDKL